MSLTQTEILRLREKYNIVPGQIQTEDTLLTSDTSSRMERLRQVASESQLKMPEKKSIPERIARTFLPKAAEGFAETIGDAVGSVVGVGDEALESQSKLDDISLQLVERIKKGREQGEDTSRLEQRLSQNLGPGVSLEKILPSTEKTTKQVTGEAIGTAAFLASLVNLPGALGSVATGTTVREGVKAGVRQGGILGGLFGTVEGASQELRQDENMADVARGALQGGLVGLLAGGAAGGVLAGVASSLTNRIARRQELKQVLQGNQPTLIPNEGLPASAAVRATARLKLTDTGNVVADKSARTLLRGVSNIDDADIVAIKQMSPADKQKAQTMLEYAERASENRSFLKRPSDVVGQTIVDDIQVIKNANRKAAQQLDTVAATLDGQPYDAQIIQSSFTDDLYATGVRISEDGKLSFDGSDFEGINSVERLLENVYNRINKLSDAKSAHRLKKYIDNQVSWGKTSEGIPGQAEALLKQVRRLVDTQLDDLYPVYNAANTEYAQTINILDEVSRLMGRRFKLEEGVAALKSGTVARRILSNSATRGDVLQLLNVLEQEAAKRSTRDSQSIVSQVVFADILEDIFGTQATTSLQGQVARATRTGLGVAQGLARGDIKGAAMAGVEMAADKLMGTTQDDLVQALRSLLSR